MPVEHFFHNGTLFVAVFHDGAEVGLIAPPLEILVDAARVKRAHHRANGVLLAFSVVGTLPQLRQISRHPRDVKLMQSTG